MTERLDKLIASTTALSRKDAKAAVRDMRVMINGAVARSAEVRIDPERDAVALDGERLVYRRHVYYMMDKPAGVVCATEDRSECTVLDILPPSLRRDGLFPAGRLDKDTTGLLILTDDGDYAHRMLSPRHHVSKRYIAALDRAPDEAVIDTFKAGVTLADGTVCRSASVELLGGCDAAVEITEGRYHQVKRMFAAVGYRVAALRRIAIGALRLDMRLGAGGVRELSAEEADLVFTETEP